MRLLIPNKHDSPPKQEVKSVSERMKYLLSEQQTKIADTYWEVFNPAKKSLTERFIAEKLGFPVWLVLQEIYYSRLLSTYFSFKSVQHLGNLEDYEFHEFFPLLAPLEDIGISEELSTILREQPRRILVDSFGRSRNVSIRYVCELFSLSLTRKDLVTVVRKYLQQEGEEEAAKIAGEEISRIDTALKEVLPTTLQPSNEQKALRRFLVSSPGLQRGNLSEHHMEVLLALRWGRLDKSKVLTDIDHKGRPQKLSNWENEAINILLEDDNFHTSSTFRYRNNL